jgi:orotidine-5'-phosphate decarboxylase
VTPVIVALDVGSAEEAVRLAKRVAPHVGGFKIGLGLLHGPGPGTIAALTDLGKPVFADAKLHDIPSQVEVAARRLGAWGARWVTAHVSGGEDMLGAAVAGLQTGSGGGAGILGVSVLTSLDESRLAAVGIASTPGKLVSRMARVASSAGCEGFVCSPRELGVVREVAPDLMTVIPGIRPAGPAGDDQQRIATPAEAITRGADWLVIGRPITRAEDPARAAEEISRDLQSGDLT